MMFYFIIGINIAITVGIWLKFRQFPWWTAIISTLTIIIGWTIATNASMTDVEYLNGVVTGKHSERVSCEHSYSCNCTTSNGSTTCQTCYRHSADYDWVVTTNIVDRPSFTINRVDSQGWYEPERWTRVRNGDYVTLPHKYRNYILVSPESIFHGISERPTVAYPEEYDYHRFDHVMVAGANIPDLRAWNDDMMRILSRLGPSKEVNAMVVLTNKPPQYGEDLRNSWLGGKQNDVVVVIGLTPTQTISWVKVFSWSKNEMLNVALRNAIMDRTLLDRGYVISTIEENIEKHFSRRSMEQYAYLRDNAYPHWFFVSLFWVIAIGAPFGVLWLINHQNSRFNYRRFK